MKNLWFFSVLSIVLALCSFYLLLNNKEGWGWFLFASVATFTYPQCINNDNEEEKEE